MKRPKELNPRPCASTLTLHETQVEMVCRKPESPEVGMERTCGSVLVLAYRMYILFSL
jgi:hypothetical protein